MATHCSEIVDLGVLGPSKLDSLLAWLLWRQAIRQASRLYNLRPFLTQPYFGP
jgi:hypothetical protein